MPARPLLSCTALSASFSRRHITCHASTSATSPTIAFDQSDGRHPRVRRHQEAPPGQRLGRHRRRSGPARQGDPQYLPGIPRQPGPAPGAAVARHVVSSARSPSAASIKTGKEADVELIERVDPLTGAACLLAAKRYRSSRHRLFHRDAGYLEGRRVRRSRENRAMADTHVVRPAGHRRAVGARRVRDRSARCGRPGVAVPYPVQIGGTELLMEFIGDRDGTAAPRLAELRPDVRRARRSLGAVPRRRSSRSPRAASPMATCRPTTSSSMTAGSCSSTFPQVVDIVGNPQGPSYLAPRLRQHLPVVHRQRPPGCRRRRACPPALAGQAGIS